MLKRIQVDWNPGVSFQPPSSQSKGSAVVLGFIQARESSKRLPGKIYLEVDGVPMLYRVVNQAKSAKLLDEVILLSPSPLSDVPECVDNFVPVGIDENDVLSRFVQCLRKNPCDYVVRLTADCPYLSPELIDTVIAAGIGSDYCSNVINLTFPDGVDAEIISADTLEWLNDTVKDPKDREHVTIFLRREYENYPEISMVSIENKTDLSGIKTSIDTESELEAVNNLCKR